MFAPFPPQQPQQQAQTQPSSSNQYLAPIQTQQPQQSSSMDITPDTPGSPSEENGVYATSDTKRTKKEPGGKKIRACIYCRRSHMVCDTHRPCLRCIKREIPDLCLEDSKLAASQLANQAARVAFKRAAASSGASSPAGTGKRSRVGKEREEDVAGQEEKMELGLGMGGGDRALGQGYQQSSAPSIQQQQQGQQAQQQQQQAQKQSQLQIQPQPQLNIPTYSLPTASSSNTTSAPNQPLQSNLIMTQRRNSTDRGGEFGILSEYLESLGIPSLPGGLGDVLNLAEPNNAPGAGTGMLGDFINPGGMELDEFGIDWGALGSPGAGGLGMGGVGGNGNGNGNGGQIKGNGIGASTGTEEETKPLIPEANSTEKFYLAAADQQSGTRDERLRKVIQAKYEAGLLKPYDYARGYARMFKWLEKNVSQASIQAILRPMSIFRPAFRAIAQSLSDLDLIFVEEAFERLMLDYDRVFSAIHTPACLWRRTGEIYKGNKEMSVLTGIPSGWFRGGNLGIFQLMDEESIVKYYQLFGSIAFDTKTKSVNTVCTLHIPSHLTKSQPQETSRTQTTATSPALGPAPTHPFNPSTFTSPISSPPLGGFNGNYTKQNFAIPPFSLDSIEQSNPSKEVRTIRCALNFTIRRDSWGMPIAIIGNWIPL